MKSSLEKLLLILGKKNEATTCLMCGEPIRKGILCEFCYDDDELSQQRQRQLACLKASRRDKFKDTSDIDVYDEWEEDDV